MRTLWHKRLHDWLKSYLKNRGQYVDYNFNQSDNKYIIHGLPQGSIMGPLLFILYMNECISVLLTEQITVALWTQ